MQFLLYLNFKSSAILQGSAAEDAPRPRDHPGSAGRPRVEGDLRRAGAGQGRRPGGGPGGYSGRKGWQISFITLLFVVKILLSHL